MHHVKTRGNEKVHYQAQSCKTLKLSHTLLSLSISFTYMYCSSPILPLSLPPLSWPQVVLQVVIAFIVEAFVLQLEQSNRKKEKLEKKILERRLSVMERRDDTDCVEGIYDFLCPLISSVMFYTLHVIVHMHTHAHAHTHTFTHTHTRTQHTHTLCCLFLQTNIVRKK